MHTVGLIWLIILIILAIILDYLLVRWLGKRWVSARRQRDQDPYLVRIFGGVSPLVTWLRDFDYRWVLFQFRIIIRNVHSLLSDLLSCLITLRADGLSKNIQRIIGYLKSNIYSGPDYSKPSPETIYLERPRLQLPNMTSMLEMGLILLWAIWVGRGYLNFSEDTLAYGSETAMATQSHYIWTMFERCGFCMLWNGQVNGGNPAFVETHGAVLHPLVILTTLLWGVINGTKILLIACLVMAGLAQWSLAKVMKLGVIPRMWSAAMAVIGGQLAGKMENGGVMMVLSIASASLIFAPAVELALRGRRRSIIWLGIALALTWLSGQGYVQVVVMLAIPAALCVFIFGRRLHFHPVWKDYFLAFFLSFLLTGIFWIPLAHFWPNFSKYSDPSQNDFLHFLQIPVNLLINNRNYFDLLQVTFNIHYIYIGWISVILAILSLFIVRPKNKRLLAFLWVGIFLIFFVCSLEFVRLAGSIFPSVYYLRNLPIATGLAVPLVLALGAWSLDCFIVEGWSCLLRGGWRWDKQGSLFTAGLLAVSIAFLTICQVYPANVRWLKVQQVDIPAVEINALIPSQSEWVTPPDVNFAWYPHLLEAGLKLTNIVRPWHWINRPAPNALLEAVLSTKPDPGFGSIRKIGYIDYLLRPGNQYAVIRTADRDIPCQAVAKDGNIDVSCSTNKDGKLIVNENRWSGWTAWRDGQPVPLLVGNFLTVDASAGSHTYSFRYWPWDVPLGLLISLLGIGMAFWLGLKRPASSMKQGANQD